MERDILVVTAPKVGDTGRVSFGFMLKIPHDEYAPLPQKWGWLRKDLQKDMFNIFVFEGGKGQVFSAGLDAESDLNWKRDVMKDFPSCTILMSEEAFEFWKEMCEQTGTEYRLYEHDEPLFTDHPVDQGVS
jgi:hypothetical protein